MAVDMSFSSQSAERDAEREVGLLSIVSSAKAFRLIIPPSPAQIFPKRELEARMLEFEEACNRNANQRLRDQMQHFRECELTQMRMEESSKYRRKLDEMRLQLEQVQAERYVGDGGGGSVGPKAAKRRHQCHCSTGKSSCAAAKSRSTLGCMRSRRSAPAFVARFHNGTSQPPPQIACLMCK